MKKQKLKRSEIIANTERLIFENFHRVSKQLGIITENLDTLDDMKQYFNDVIHHLEVLDSGNKCINNAKTNPNIISYIKNNFERGFSADHTAGHIRDSWYGV